MILDTTLNLTLRPMKYPAFYEMYKNAIKNTWTVEEVDFSSDLVDLKNKLSSAEKHLIKRLIAFFATGDSIVSNNLVLNLYKHINSPEARLYLSRQLYEEALHVQFYLTLLDSYIPDPEERNKSFAAINNISSIKKKADFCLKWIDSINNLDKISNEVEEKQFLLNLITFACAIEGIFFFSAFAYVYFLRSKGLLNGLAAGTNWVFRDETAHIAFALETINVIRSEKPHLFDAKLKEDIVSMIKEAVDCESTFADDLLSFGVSGLSSAQMKQYLHFIADQRLVSLGLPKIYNVKNPFDFIELQNVQEITNFFERRVSAYSTNIEGKVAFDEDF